MKSLILPVLLLMSTSLAIGQSAVDEFILASTTERPLSETLMPRQTVDGPKVSKIGILCSALIPGTGEMLNKSWVKGTVFVGVEIALWFGYSHYNSKGNDWEDVFHDYADTHWSEQRWLDYYNPEMDPSTHSLPETKTQQYYEMIVKYNQFKLGWDDWQPGSPALTDNRNDYEEMRHNSNVEFKRASFCAMGVLANHLFSALIQPLPFETETGSTPRCG